MSRGPPGPPKGPPLGPPPRLLSALCCAARRRPPCSVAHGLRAPRCPFRLAGETAGAAAAATRLAASRVQQGLTSRSRGSSVDSQLFCACIYLPLGIRSRSSSRAVSPAAVRLAASSFRLCCLQGGGAPQRRCAADEKTGVGAGGVCLTSRLAADCQLPQAPSSSCCSACRGPAATPLASVASFTPSSSRASIGCA
ncbi:hypothetical protein Efla_003820 [Eimeria flavescens]